MGYISQNIQYETSLNNWDGVKEAVFSSEKDSFYLLSKSYRNTIEISNCAGMVLEKASQGDYKIEPIIRHENPVNFIQTTPHSIENKLIQTIQSLRSKDYRTIAIICRTFEESDAITQLLTNNGIQLTTASNSPHDIKVLPVLRRHYSCFT